MSLEINFFLKQTNQTVPLKFLEPSMVIAQLLRTDIAQVNGESYFYQDLHIRNQKVNIFLTPQEQKRKGTA